MLFMNYLSQTSVTTGLRNFLISRTVWLATISGILLTYNHVAIASTPSPNNHLETPGNNLHYGPDRTESRDTITAKDKDNELSQDSTAYLLPGATVEAKNYLHTPKKSIYTPSKSEKNNSIDAKNLLKRMSIPQLVVTASGDFTAAGGAPISYFINGMPASPEELSGMNMNDVKKVEYLDFPDDVNFMSAPHVINFIVQEYQSGGYTRVGINQQYPGGYYLSENLFSRWNYRKMTYDLSLSASNSDIRHYYSTRSDIFRFDSGTVERSRIPEDGNARSETYPVQFRALYANGTTYISNSVGYSYQNWSRNSEEGVISYKGYPLTENSFKTDNPSRTSSVSWDGFGYFGLGNDWSLSAQGKFNYSHYRIRNSYMLFGNDDASVNPFYNIKNYINENSIDGKLDIVSSKRFSQLHSFNMTANASFHNSNMNYLETMQKSSFDFYSLAFKGGYSLNLQKLYLNTTLGVADERTSMDGFVVNTLYPFGTVSLNYIINQTNNLYLWMQYSTFSPMISAKNPVLVQYDELSYTIGNPELKPYPRYELTFNYMLQLGVFRVFSMFHWNHTFNTARICFTPMQDRVGMLKSYVNGGHTDDVSLRINMSISLFNNKLLIATTPEYRIQRPSYPGYPTLHPVEMYSAIIGYFGNFFAEANFLSGKSKKYDSQGMYTITDSPHKYWLSGGWGNGKIRAELGLHNIFSKKTNSNRTMVISPYLNSTIVSHSPYDCRQIIFRFSYTFGYGKKVDQGNELNGNVSKSESAINL